MKYQLLLSTLALLGHASAFSGQMAASALIDQEGPSFQTIYLTDYNTGSTYQGLLYGGFKSCSAIQCSILYVLVLRRSRNLPLTETALLRPVLVDIISTPSCGERVMDVTTLIFRAP